MFSYLILCTFFEGKARLVLGKRLVLGERLGLGLVSYEAGFYKPTILKSKVGLQHMQQRQVYWNIPLSLFAPPF